MGVLQGVGIEDVRVPGKDTYLSPQLYQVRVSVATGER